MTPPAEVAKFDRDGPASECDVTTHALLKLATNDVHERLHRQRGFAGIQQKTIGLADYGSLLGRLYGFYVSFEAATHTAPVRSAWLEQDLLALDATPASIGALPACADFPPFDHPEHILGALYVVQGSALGGRLLARNLDYLLGESTEDGRRFFIGHGAETGKEWRDFLVRLSLVPLEKFARERVVCGGLATFLIFENWLGGWESVEHDHG